MLTAQELNATCPYADPMDLKRVGWHVKATEPDSVVMLGAGPGVFALAVLENYYPKHFIVIDHDTVEWVAAHLQAVGLLEEVIFIKADSTEYAALSHAVDFLIIDADHTYEGVKRDVEAWWPKVKTGGYVYFHDYIPLEENNGVKQAIEELQDETWEAVEQIGWGILFRKMDI